VCTGGGELRASRKGLEWVRQDIATAADFLINSIVLRTLGKIYPLKCWCQVSREKLGRIGTWFLPGVNEVDDFLLFVGKAIGRNGKGKKRKNECADFTSEQFLRTLDDKFKSHLGLERVLTHWKNQAPKFLKKFAKEVEDSRVPASNRREHFIRGMVNEFVEGGCSENGTRLKFACAQVCADLEELIDGLPFGAISQLCTGPGSRAGFSVFQEHEKLLDKLKKLSNLQLAMLGLEKCKAGIRVIYNKRICSRVDEEHGGCKIGVFVPKLPGGGGSTSRHPRKQAPHCHPVCKQSFEDGVSEDSMKTILGIGAKAVASFKEAVTKGTWETPEGILGEKCWTRPLDYLEQDHNEH
jgi:hypothetical protein